MNDRNINATFNDSLNENNENYEGNENQSSVYSHFPIVSSHTTIANPQQKSKHLLFPSSAIIHSNGGSLLPQQYIGENQLDERNRFTLCHPSLGHNFHQYTNQGILAPVSIPTLKYSTHAEMTTLNGRSRNEMEALHGSILNSKESMVNLGDNVKICEQNDSNLSSIHNAQQSTSKIHWNSQVLRHKYSKNSNSHDAMEINSSTLMPSFAYSGIKDWQSYSQPYKTKSQAEVVRMKQNRKKNSRLDGNLKRVRLNDDVSVAKDGIKLNTGNQTIAFSFSQMNAAQPLSSSPQLRDYNALSRLSPQLFQQPYSNNCTSQHIVSTNSIDIYKRNSSRLPYSSSPSHSKSTFGQQLVEIDPSNMSNTMFTSYREMQRSNSDSNSSNCSNDDDLSSSDKKNVSSHPKNANQFFSSSSNFRKSNDNTLSPKESKANKDVHPESHKFVIENEDLKEERFDDAKGQERSIESNKQKSVMQAKQIDNEKDIKTSSFFSRTSTQDSDKKLRKVQKNDEDNNEFVRIHAQPEECYWPQSSSETLVSMRKYIASVQILGKELESNPLIMALSEKQKVSQSEFPASAQQLLNSTFSQDSDSRDMEKVHLSSEETNSSRTLMDKLMTEKKLPSAPIFLTCTSKCVSIISVKKDTYHSLYTANIESGIVVKQLCNFSCNCCNFSSLEKCMKSILDNTDVGINESWRSMWNRVLIQIPSKDGYIKNMRKISFKSDGKVCQFAFLPLSQYLHPIGAELENTRNDLIDENLMENNANRIMILEKSKDAVDEKSLLHDDAQTRKNSGTSMDEKKDSYTSDNHDKEDRTLSDMNNATVSNLNEGAFPSHIYRWNKALQNLIQINIDSRNYLSSKMSLDYPNSPIGQIWMTSKTILPEINGGESLLGRKWVWDEGYYADFEKQSESLKRRYVHECQSLALKCRSYCTCGIESDSAEKTDGGRTRRSTGNSVKLSHVLTELAGGKLNPHTLVSCETYNLGPELNQYSEVNQVGADILAQLVKEKGGETEVQPFKVRVSPDATFLADLHAHLSQSEVIGLLGGRWVLEEKCVYIQAAFPCRAADSGSTDVEMDPVSQVTARNSIAAHGLKVVGWYHSHPTFQPDPSVTDIENQGNYQQLFASANVSNESLSKCLDDSIPFVGLIIGTYDGRNPTARSVMRWFHVTPKETGNLKAKKNNSSGSKNVDFSLSKRMTKERVLFPMKLEVTHRRFRSIDAIFKECERKVLTRSGTQHRLKRKMHLLDLLRDEKRGEIEMFKNKKPLVQSKKKNNTKIFVCQEITNNTGLKEKEKLENHLENEINVKNSAQKSLCENAPVWKLIEKKNDPKVAFTFESCKQDSTDVFNRKPMCNSVVELCIPANPLNAFVYGEVTTKASFHVWSCESRKRKLGKSCSSKISLYDHVNPINTKNCSEVVTLTQLTSDFYDQKSYTLGQSLIKCNSVQKNLRSISCDSTTNLEIDVQRKDERIAAYPLSFSSKEFDILNRDVRVGDEELARIIWEAVEREQFPKQHRSDSTCSSWVTRHLHQIAPASSHSILKLLILSDRIYFTDFDFDSSERMEKNESKKNGKSERNSGNQAKRQYAKNDIALIDSIDALLSHYATNERRIDINDNWSCSAGSGIYHGSNSGLSSNGSGNYSKMKKGHKICVSLLQWTRYMQLDGIDLNTIVFNDLNETNSNHSPDFQTCKEEIKMTDQSKKKILEASNNKEKLNGVVSNLRAGQKESCYPNWDNEKCQGLITHVNKHGKVFFGKKKVCEFKEKNTSIKFTAEIMRLLSARWREANWPIESETKRKKKRGRPSRLKK